MCCESSKMLYCHNCCKILIPKEDWPTPIQDGSLRLPFDVDIILDAHERRSSATGIHMVAISSAANGASLSSPSMPGERPPSKVQLFDLERKEVPPSYYSEDDGTYVLFPSKDSVPISNVGDIKKLIVLDCKWATTSMQMHPSVASLPKVHLDSPPAESYFWRWHNSGAGMLSTMEAIYFSAYQVTFDWPNEERQQLVHIMWLFALQRSMITKRSEQELRPPPFTSEQKEIARMLRKQHNRCRPND
jgi:hypothetical protein